MTLNRKISAGPTFAVFAILIVVGLFVGAYINPRLNVPVVSKIACSAHSGTWSDGSDFWGVPAGCSYS